MEKGLIDAADGDDGTQEVFGQSMSDKVEKEQELLDSLQIDGFPKDEQARRKAWLRLPRVTRASIGRTHKMLRHTPSSVVLRIVRGAGGDKEVINGIKLLKCGDCLDIEKASGHADGEATIAICFQLGSDH